MFMHRSWSHSIEWADSFRWLRWWRQGRCLCLSNGARGAMVLIVLSEGLSRGYVVELSSPVGHRILLVVAAENSRVRTEEFPTCCRFYKTMNQSRLWIQKKLLETMPLNLVGVHRRDDPALTSLEIFDCQEISYLVSRMGDPGHQCNMKYYCIVYYPQLHVNLRTYVCIFNILL